MKTLLLALLLLLAVAVHAQESNLIQDYDRFENQTRYWTRPVFVERGLDLTAHFTFKGKGAGHDVDGFYLIFSSKNSDWQYLKNSRLILLADGESIDLGSARYQDNDIKSGYSSVEVKEVLIFPVRYSTLQKLSKSGEVEARLGRTEFHLSQRFLDSLKELLSKVQVVRMKK